MKRALLRRLGSLRRRARRASDAWVDRNPRLGASLRRAAAVARKELRQLVRDPLTMGFVVGLPAIQLVLFGYAINQDVRHIPTAVVDYANSSASRLLIGQLEASQTFRITHRPPGEDAARTLLENGTVDAVVEVPADFSRRYYRGRGAQVSILVNAGDPTRARAVRAAADGLAERHNQRLQRFEIAPQEKALEELLQGSLSGAYRAPRQRGSFAAEPDLIQPRFLEIAVLNLYNPELRTALFVVPALLGVILTTTMIMMTALALVREREKGTFELLIATPVKRVELMAGKILPYIGIGAIQILIVLGSGLALFRVPVHGNLADLAVASLVFIAANLSLGLVISSKVSSQFQATQLSFFFFLPSVLLSGFMFPFEAMPVPAQWLGELLPLTHFVRICRGILLRGTPLTGQLGDLLALAVFAVAGFAVATRLFAKKLD